MSKETEATSINCPNCDGLLDEAKVMTALETKGSFKCTHCGSLIEADEETDSDNSKNEKAEAQTQVSKGEKKVSTSTETTKAPAAAKTAKAPAQTDELPKGGKVVGDKDAKPAKAAKAEKVAPAAIDHEAIIADVRKKLLEDKTVGERVHDTYVSFYKNEKGTARGKRFLVIYRNGRNIKAQFFGIEKSDNPNIRPLETEADAFEYKGKDVAEFKKYLDTVI